MAFTNNMNTRSTCSGAQCTIDIHIDCRGDVNIYNCSTPGESAEHPPALCPEEPTCASCLSPVAGGKHKTSRDYKLARLADGVRVPSTLAASIVHTARRFLLGKAPQNPLEKAAFESLQKMSRDTLSCAVAAFSALPAATRRRLFAPSLLLGADEAIDAGMLSAAFADELAQRVGLLVFENRTAAEDERPGSMRVYEPQGEDFFSQVRICRINNLRTANYLPVLSPAEFLPGEIQQDCQPKLVDGQNQVICQVRTGDCPGAAIGNVCARVPDIAAGDGVVLQGVNFFSLEAKVRLTDRQTGTIVRDVPVHLWGDVETPVTEVVDGVTRLINDCRVHDRLSFRVPEDLPPAIYYVQVVVPNVTGIAALGTAIKSSQEAINVIPPPTARFQIVTEKIRARAETSPSWFGSDEVGLHTIAVPLFANGNFGTPQEQKFEDIQDVEFDSGTSRDITRVIFNHDQPIMGMALSVLGYEIDSQHAYDEQVRSSTEYFVDLVKEQVELVGDILEKLKKAGIDVLDFGWTGAALAAIGIGVTIGVDIIIALWAPADLIIQDSFGLTITDLATLTSANAPAPAPHSFETEDGIMVNVNTLITPLKLPLEYHETREYVSSDEDSRYELTYRFNRLA
jgi:hypothetical protein